jgi:peptide-methionine (R)-S-oxide reductase
MKLFLILLVLTNNFCSAQEKNKDKKNFPIQKSEAEWRKILTEKEFNVIREHGTERPFSGELNENKKSGKYTCTACGAILFHSSTKFDSGTGWPSFYDISKEKNVGSTEDYSFGMKRTEVHCNKCGGHLGHVFEDGPKPTGLRYCINSVSLKFIEEPKK